MLHIPDVDWQSTVTTFRDALAEVKAWSVAHPSHTPLAIYVEVMSTKGSVGSAVGPNNLQYINALLAPGPEPKTCVPPPVESRTLSDCIQCL